MQLTKPRVHEHPGNECERTQNKWVRTVWNKYCNPADRVTVPTGANYFEELFAGEFGIPDNGVDPFAEFETS